MDMRIVGFALVVAVSASIGGAAETPKGMAQDWTTHHVIFSNPGSEEQAIQQGTHDRWLKIVTNPRYIQQQQRRSKLPDAESTSISRAPAKKRPKNLVTKDWSEDLGPYGVGIGNFPAIYTTGASSCTDFAVFNTGANGSSSQATIVAFQNIYSSCGTPTVRWAYNTGAAIDQSVVLYTDGVQVAFAVGSFPATLTILKTAPGTGSVSSPTTPGAVSASAYPSCTAPCMTTLFYSPGHYQTSLISSPYYDNGSDTLYVGDGYGLLHKFTNVFNESGSDTAPAEVTTGGWPASVAPDIGLCSPVYDATSGNVFVTDYYQFGQTGYLYAVNSSTGAVTQSGELTYSSSYLNDAPLVDSAAGEVYVFVGRDATSACSGGGNCARVFQFPTNFTAGASGAQVIVGTGGEPMLSGAFDNEYYTSDAVAPTGHLYVVGNTGPSNNTLYQIPITNNVMGAPVAGPVLSTNYTNSLSEQEGLQVTEFFDVSAAADYIFTSVQSYCSPLSSSEGCLLGFNVTNPATFSASTAPTGSTLESGGTSGIVVDNGSSNAQNIYFSTLGTQSCTTSGGTGSCAIQLSQKNP